MAIAGFRNISELLEIQERGIDPPTFALRIRSSRARSGTPLPVKKGAPVPKKKSELPQIEINADGTPKRKPGRPLKRPGGAAPSTATEFARITLAKEHALAGLRQLEYEQRAGTVVAIDVARRVLFEEARGARDAWLNWPARIAPILAARLGVEPDAALRVLTDLVREQLERVGAPDGDFIRES
ncbi:hypothetical protein G3N58_32195 [Paraburkholderia sp. Ac-20342]|uniref:hypothetical protein n=1 Tax=Paraburkholderia sp. Ac-20342 TaxID=2703889 RepID=UPI0019816F2E|nr:hypothetical protein [Paraburkholderia sp. Ac-20342]MBN3851442.1 hypothetical protein [Paraburkholderia sp. Ac-20342]